MAQLSYSSISDFILFSSTFVPGGTIFPGPRHFFDATDDGIVFTRPQSFASTGYFNIDPTVTVSGPGLTVGEGGQLFGTIETMVLASDNRGEVGRVSGLSINGAAFSEVIFDRIDGDRFSGDAFNRLLGEGIGEMVLSDEGDNMPMRGLVDYLSRVDLGGGDDVFRAGRPDTSGLTVEGGAGFDVLRLDDFNGDDPFIVNLAAGVVQAGSQIFQFSGFEQIDGNAFVQRYIGSVGDDIIRAAGRADDMSGAGGNDLLDGGFGDDILNGDPGRDTLEGGSGDDRLNGGGDIDWAVFDGPRSGYTLTLSATGTTLTDRRENGTGTDVLTGIEYLDFGDTDIDYGLFQQTGIATLDAAQLEGFVELYIAYFNRAPDATGLAFWGTAFANGIDPVEIASLFIQSDEYKATYADDLSNADFATAVYSNVLGRAPDQTGFDFWVGALDAGGVTRDQFIVSVLGGAKVAPPQDATPAFIAQQLQDREYLANKTDIGAYFAVHKGMSDVADATAAMQLFDGTGAGITAAVNAIDGFYTEALNADTGAFLVQVVGVLDDPFGGV